MPLLFDSDAFNKVPKKDTRMLMKKIDWLWEHRHEIRHLQLKENLVGYFKRRVDPYRIIYSYENEEDVMIIHLVGTRTEIYINAGRHLS